MEKVQQLGTTFLMLTIKHAEDGCQILSGLEWLQKKVVFKERGFALVAYDLVLLLNLPKA